jgi:ubiquinone/menaquinone biosynthesis C-methylase UbiE
MNSKIKLLCSELLNDKQKLNKISYWLKVLNRPNGWHYDLDQIWILHELEVAGIKPGATIVDAGAGQGVMQYLLASYGYNIISLDFSPRTVPARSVGIFDINGAGDEKIEYEHPYMKFISYGDDQTNTLLGRLKFSSLKKLPYILFRIYRAIISFFYYIFERFSKKHNDYGKITYLRAPFHEIPLESNSVDAVISISAIEHADIEVFDNNISELLRVLRDGSPFLLTTSATKEKENIYLKKCEGWCFSLDSLKKYFDGADVEFDTENCESSLLKSNILINRLDPYYYHDRESFCFKKKLSSLPYLPVAIKVIKGIGLISQK